MARIRSLNEIIQNTLDFIRAAQPKLDTKPGTVSRDIVIDAPSSQLSKLYEELARISTTQSIRLSVGSDVDDLSQNFGAIRKTGSISSGVGLYTFSSLNGDIAINKGDTATSSNGATFVVTRSIVVSSVFASSFKATAAKYRADLDFVGISDQYAVEVPLQAVSTGTSGNISKYSLNSTSTSGVSNVTNAVAFGGGQGPEDDASFKNRVLSIFSGANTGTSLGYSNAVLADQAVLDAIVIEPGDPLMTRDGTIVKVNSDGTRTITSEGTGGKVDVIIHGNRLQQNIDSYIYRDLSNKGDPTNSVNDFVLGQIASDAGKTVSRKRIDDIAAQTLPAQPVNNISQVSGTISGGNFVQQTVDSLGRISGNYVLIRDTGAYAGSPFGFDRLHWISNKISGFQEDKTKSKFNSQDPTTYPDLLEIDGVQQNIQITNENGIVSASDRTSIQLPHKSITSVTRVFNTSTGERYTVSNQNPDGNGNVNYSGRIIINGSSLPSTSDILQIDYIWVQNYDPSFDFDNRLTNNNPRQVVDSIDWGLSNVVRREQATIFSSAGVNQVLVTHPVGSVLTINTFVPGSSSVSIVNGILAVVVNQDIKNVVSIIRVSDNAELYFTGKNDGTFTGKTIFLPTDTIAVFADAVNIVYNSNDTFTVGGISGSFNNNTITLSPSSTATPGTIVECNYIANVNALLPATQIANLPASKNVNSFNTQNLNATGSQPTTHIYSGLNIIQNLRQAPSKLALTLSGSISPGVFTIKGTTITGVFDAILTVSSNSLKQNLASVIKTFLGLTTIQAIPSYISAARITKVERVETTSSLDVLSVINAYDVKGYKLASNTFVKNEAEIDLTLLPTEFSLPATTNNNSNIPQIGDRLRITFYISNPKDSENISFSKTGTLYTDKTFALIDMISVSSGFTSASSQIATLTINNLNQPTTGSRYTATYDYIAPKVNERITVASNFNRLISDSTLTIEGIRPINADVLAKSSVPILINVSQAIVVTSAYANTPNVVKQNVIDTITSYINSLPMGSIIDESDLMNAANTVQGVDRVRPIEFNIDPLAGRVLSITAQKNEYFVANLATVNIETR
jgi:hypothetical protein